MLIPFSTPPAEYSWELFIPTFLPKISGTAEGKQNRSKSTSTETSSICSNVQLCANTTFSFYSSSKYDGTTDLYKRPYTTTAHASAHVKTTSPPLHVLCGQEVLISTKQDHARVPSLRRDRQLRPPARRWREGGPVHTSSCFLGQMSHRTFPPALSQNPLWGIWQDSSVSPAATQNGARGSKDLLAPRRLSLESHKSSMLPDPGGGLRLCACYFSVESCSEPIKLQK